MRVIFNSTVNFDEEDKVEINYSKKLGINVKLFDSSINISPEGKEITLSLNDGNRIVKLNEKGISFVSDKISSGTMDGSAEPSVLGDKNVDQLSLIWDAIKKINDDNLQFHTQQQAITSSVGILSPLTGAHAKAMTASTKNKSTIESGKGKVKTVLSKVNTLD